MDANKLEVLREIGYRIRPCCFFCENSVFPNNEWGTCEDTEYDHLKHGDARKLSIVKYGWCDGFVPDETRYVTLGRFDEFTR